MNTNYHSFKRVSKSHITNSQTRVQDVYIHFTCICINNFFEFDRFIVGDKARTAVKLSKEQRLNLICQNYSRALNSSEANHVSQ